MEAFVRLISEGLSLDHDVRAIRPSRIVGRVPVSNKGVRKWLGYIDRFLLFPIPLVLAARSADVVHICDQANALYAFLFRRKPNIVTCHDVLAIRSAQGAHPENAVSWTGRIYQKLTFRALLHAKRVVCVSTTTEAALVGLGRIRAEGVAVVENALNYPYSPLPAHAAWRQLERLGLPPDLPFLLHVGGDVWYKNRVGLLRIFSEICTHPDGRRLHLVMAGAPITRELADLIAELGIGDRVHSLVDLDAEDLRALYNAAQALVFPSLHEGFGWPIIEAQACGCPVFASAREPLPIVGGAGALYFDPENPTCAATVILRGLKEKRSLLQAGGFANVLRYSRARMISGYTEAYRRVIAGGTSGEG